MNTFSVRLTTAQTRLPDAASAGLLDIAANIFESDYSIPVVLIRSSPGVSERGDLTTAIELARLALTAVTTVVAVLTYLKSLEPKCSYRIRLGNREVMYDGKAPSKEIEARLTAWLEAAGPDQGEMTVEIEM